MNRNAVINKLLFLGLMLFALNASAVTREPGEVVEGTVGGVLDRLGQERDQLEAHPERIYELIQELVIPHFDFSSMSKWVLGKSNWSNATPEQRDVFVEQFKTLLVRTYAKALLEFSEEKIVVNEVIKKGNSNLVTVKTEVKQPGGATSIPINYRMHISDGEWKVVDVTVDGISLVRSYRGSFASQIKENGLEALIATLTEKNNKLAQSLKSGN